jgi:hypothetical protein
MGTMFDSTVAEPSNSRTELIDREDSPLNPLHSHFDRISLSPTNIESPSRVEILHTDSEDTIVDTGTTLRFPYQLLLL